MSTTTTTSSTGISVFGMLGVLFVGLKLTGFINWSWWWVTAPFWGPFAVALAILLLIGVGWLLYKAFSKTGSWK